MATEATVPPVAKEAAAPPPRLSFRNIVAFAILGAFLGMIVTFARAILAPPSGPGGGNLLGPVLAGAAIAAILGPILRAMALRGGFPGFLARLTFRLATLSVFAFFIFLFFMRMGSKS